MRITIHIRATKLSNVAGTFKGKSDPFAVVTLLASDRGAKPSVLGETEVVKNTLEPDWIKTFTVDYDLGKPSNVLVKIFDEVRKGDNISMGSAVFDIGAVLGAKGNAQAKKLKNGGTIFMKVQKNESKSKLKLKLSGSKLKNTEGMFSKSDPFYEITKKDQGLRGTEWNVVHRSSHIKNNLDPKWPEDTIDLTILCDDDLDQMLKLNVFDHEKSGKHVLMGGIETSVNGLINAAKATRPFHLMRRGKDKGTLIVQKAELFEIESPTNVPVEEMERIAITPIPPPAQPSAPITPVANPSAPPFVPTAPPGVFAPKTGGAAFEDYLSGGCEISLSVAIDFTGSNGDPRKPGTLHHLSPDGSPNDYEKAIRAIGSTLANFDADKKFPVWGFGAKYGGVVRHFFQCGPVAEVDGVEGVIDAYRQTFKSGLVMSGPTVITEIVQTAGTHALSAQEQAKAEGKQKYSILLILTDGAVSDVNATLQAIKSVHHAPLSVVIVGIGSADFRGMQFLDDNGSGPDIVQFVEFNAHRHSSTSLTSATLDEIPHQLEQYFIRNGIQPNPAVQVDDEEIVVAPAEEEIDLALDFDADGRATCSSGGMYVPPGSYGHAPSSSGGMYVPPGAY